MSFRACSHHNGGIAMAQADRYGYSVARLRAMEKRNLDPAVLQRMVDSEDLQAALKILGETCYAQWLVELKSDADFDRAIEAELAFIYGELQKFVPDAELLEICRMPYDFHNIKVLFKSAIRQRRHQEKRWDLLTGMGNIATDDLIMAVESDDYRLLPYGLSSELPACFSLWEQNQDIVEVEKKLDGFLFETMLMTADRSKIPGLISWIRGRIDAENVRNLARLKRFGLELSQVPGFLHDGGWVPMDRLISLYGESLESWGRILGFADVGAILQKMGDISEIENLLVDLEKTLDDYVTGLLQKARYDAFSPVNVLLYLWTKEMESRNVRIILVGKANGAGSEVVRRLLRHV